MPRMISTARWTYDKQELEPGDEFDCDDKFVTTVLIAGKATMPNDQPKQRKRKSGRNNASQGLH